MITAAVLSSPFACPSCHEALEMGAAELRCETCGRGYQVFDGVPSFCETESFYEDYLEEHCPFVASPPSWKATLLRVLPYWSWREWRFFDAYVPSGARILDLGCARGKEWFSSKASFIAGVDPIRAPLSECAEHYDAVAQANITALPFPDGFFDCVVTSHVIGHIGLDEKDRAFSEISRVLQPGGVSVNIIETDSNHPFAQYGKSDPELYHVNFIETDGHIGLELPSSVIARFESHGFVVNEVRKMESARVHLRYYGKYLGKGYPERSPEVRRRITRWERISDNRAVLAGYEVFIGSYHRFVEPWRSHLDDSMFIAVAAQKKRKGY